MTIKKIARAGALPAEWNNLSRCYFQTIDFLLHSETYNPCTQRYYLCYKHNTLVAGAIAYTLCLDLFTYLSIKSPVKMNIIGVPCSVSASGFTGDSMYRETIMEWIKRNEQGIYVYLNLDTPLTQFDFCHTLPTIVLKNSFKSINHYYRSFKAHYRYWIKKNTLRCNPVTIAAHHNSDFSQEMYAQYSDIFNKSRAKLEKLSFDFFKNLPLEFKLKALYLKKELMGWYLTLFHNKVYYYFLGGHSIQQNKTYGIYLTIIKNIIEEGISRGADYIELGQTAEIPKMRYGGNLQRKYMSAHHSNILFNKMLIIFKSFLQYKKRFPEMRPFRKDSGTKS